MSYSPPHTSPYPNAPSSGQRPFNVLGAIALALVAVDTFLNGVWPFLFQAGDLSLLQLVGWAQVGSSAFLLISAVSLAIGGLLQSSATRGRWMAYVALGGGATSLLSIALSSLANWVAFDLF